MRPGSRLRRFHLLGIFTLLTMFPLSLATPTLADNTVPVTVTITKVDTNGDGLEGFGRGPADLYAGVRINGILFDSFNAIDGDNDHVEPFWSFTNQVPAANVSVPVSIEIWDWDECDHPFCNDTGVFESDDDKADADPGGDDEVNLTVTLADGKWTGDANWPSNCLEGTGDSRARVCWDINVGSGASDNDGDGLLDGWERNGFNDDGDGTIDVDLPAMGAKVDHKDLFLELDYEAGQSPARADIRAMKSAFAAAPLGNPDGVPGVKMHVDMGNLVDANAREGQALGTCSDGIDNRADGTTDGGDPDCKFLDGSVEDPLPTNCADGIDNDGDGVTDAADTECLVGDNLGGGSAVTPAGACNLDSTFYAAKKINFNSNRRWIFRYAISAALPGTCPSSGGWGEIGGNDFMEFNHDGGTIMHELGHTLNLQHGGFEGANCKPNYISGMNYDNQFGINRAGGGVIIDYSPPRLSLDGTFRGTAPTGNIVENALNEATIVDSTDDRNRFVFVDGTGAKIQNPINAGEDWNGDGDFADSGLTANIDTNATGGGPVGCTNGANNSTLKGSEDWTTRVSLPFRQFGDSADGAINPVTDPEPTLAELLDLHADLNTTDLSVAVTDAHDPVAAGEQLTYSLTISNLGGNPATSVKVTDTLPTDVSFASGSAECSAATNVVTCNLGEMQAHTTRTLSIVVNVPANLVYLNGGPKTVTNVATILNLAGPDSNTGNDSDTDTTQVIAKADAKITSVTTNSPLEVLIGKPSTATVDVVVANGGPSSPVDAVLTGAASASAGSSVSPATTTNAVTALLVGTPQTVSQTFTLNCTAPGLKSISFNYAIALKNAPVDVDPDLTNNSISASFQIDCVVPVAINVRPGGFPNSINLNTDATLAVLTTQAGEYGLPLAFDATTIQPLTARWGLASNLFNVGTAAGAKEMHNKGHLERSYELDEKTRDADIDMVMHFKPSESGLTASTTEGCLKGKFTASDGNVYTFFGCDSVRIVGKNP